MSQYALVTGASSGLGLELAKCFAKDKVNVVLVARREDRLKSICEELKGQYGIDAQYFGYDLSSIENVKALVRDLENKNLKIDYLVNNAGMGCFGTFVERSTEEILQMINLNITSLVALTRLLLPNMLERKSGHILNIGSTGGFQPGPFFSTYYATKAFVNSFSEAMTEELKGTGVQVTLSCPGPTATEFGNVAKVSDLKILDYVMMDSAKVAGQAYQAMKNSERRIIHGLGNRILAILAGWMPNSMNLKIVRNMHGF